MGVTHDMLVWVNAGTEVKGMPACMGYLPTQALMPGSW